jgi:hypothetical protein
MHHQRSDEPTEPPEVFEHIPWAELAAPTREKRLWTVYLAAGVIAAGSLGALAARSFGQASKPPPVAVATTSSVPPVVSLPPPTTTQEETISEADLLAQTPGQGEISAAARAEWFVADYFSSGGDPAASRAVLDALPANSRLPTGIGSGSGSYVEWVATARIESIGSEQYRSTVLFRTLVSGADGSYVRLPVQAVDVVVEVDAGGGTRVVDLPMPAEIPAGPNPPTWEDPSEEVPELIHSAALRLAAGWGSEPVLIEGNQRIDGWRVVVGVGDESGVRWPLTLWLTEQGDPA